MTTSDTPDGPDRSIDFPHPAAFPTPYSPIPAPSLPGQPTQRRRRGTAQGRSASGPVKKRMRVVIADRTDLLALMTVALGFVPEESIVMLALAGDSTFHARVDLPPVAPLRGCAADPTGLDGRAAEDSGYDEVVQALLAPLHHHGAERVAFAVFTEGVDRAERAVARLVEEAIGLPMPLLDLLVAHRSSYRPLDPTRSVADTPAVDYDVRSDAIVASAVLEGRVVLGSRSELAETVAADELAVARVAAELSASVPRRRGEERLRAEASWLRARLDRQYRLQSSGGVAFDDATAARVMRGVCQPALRDEVMAALDIDRASEWVEVWRDLCRRAPDQVLAPVAAILGMSAWADGNGALAWCAWDRSHRAGPCGLADVLAQLLERAVPPSAWAGLQSIVRQDALVAATLRGGDAAS